LVLGHGLRRVDIWHLAVHSRLETI
jgi:hypothetical protein